MCLAASFLSLTFKSGTKFQQTMPYHVIFDLFRSTEQLKTT